MDETPDLPALLPGVTYLREVAIESQELYTELRYAGFTERQALNLVGQMVIDALESRDEDEYDIEFVESDDDELEDDDYDDRDGS